MYRMLIAVPTVRSLGWSSRVFDAGLTRRGRCSFGPGTTAGATSPAVAFGTANPTNKNSAPQIVVRGAAPGLHSWNPPV